MKDRASRRSDCEVYPPWEDFMVFREFALSNGWTEGCAVCRIGDTGNYEPSNVRFGTRGSNTVEAKALHYKFTNPEGKEVSLYNLRAFCRDNNLDQAAMLRVSKGKSNSHKGWRKP